MKKHFFQLVCLVSLTFFRTEETWAFPSILADWQSLYSSSASSDTVSCQLCHRDSGGGEPWNDYGWAVRVRVVGGMTNNAAFQDVELLNSDSDPTSSNNLVEIQNNTQPGWTVGLNNTIHFKDGSFVTGQEPLNGVNGVILDPVSVPIITVSPGSIDFSTIRLGKNGTADLQISNTGLSDLHIDSINLCAGTSSEISWSALGNTIISSGASSADAHNILISQISLN